MTFLRKHKLFNSYPILISSFLVIDFERLKNILIIKASEYLLNHTNLVMQLIRKKTTFELNSLK